MGGRIYLILFGILLRLAHRFLFPVPHGLRPDGYMGEMLLTTMLTVALRLRGEMRRSCLCPFDADQWGPIRRGIWWCTEFKVKSSGGNLRPFIANYGGNNPFDYYHFMCQESWPRMTC